MGGACSVYGEESGVNRVLWGNLRERGHWGDPDVDGMIILRWIFRKLERGCGNSMESDQDRDRWRALLSTGKNLRVP
jgi:hypothetical protein